ncbi:MAG: VIT domain-containing protein [Thermodesulfovibrionales bacterium]
MNKKAGVIFIAVLIVMVLTGTFCHAREALSVDKTLSPYFFVISDDPRLDRMPLSSTKAEVQISGVIADVTVTQVYKNEGKRTLEAVYVFPASTRAAVYGMKMTIGKRIVEAKIKKRGDARQDYEDAKKQGRSASLLEQQRPNVFQMNVANILPGDVIVVELRYTELMLPTDKVYEFVYPPVVGPRYSNQQAATAPASEGWVENPHLHQGEAPAYSFDIRVRIAAGLPIRHLACSSHKISVTYDGPSRATAALDKAGTKGGNRDYILKYQLAGGRIESGLLLSESGKENFFLLMLQPPKRVSPADIPGREYIFIVDVSGSMFGFPLDISKKLFRDLLTNLRPADKFNVLLFSGGSAVLSQESLAATPENIKNGIAFIDRQKGGGGTELLPALKRALSLPQASGYARSVVIATDGYVTVEEEVFDLIRQNLNKANIFTFGIGSSVNRHLLEGMARVGMGEPFVITKPEEAPARAAAFRTLVQSPLLSHISVGYDGFKAYDIEPLTIPDMLSDRPVIIFGKWQGKPSGTITVKGMSGSGPFSEKIDVGRVKPLAANKALRYLWARHRISLLSDYNLLRSDDKRVREVTRLGLDHNLLTAFTSFVAVDNEVRNKNGDLTRIRQPLPMPEGVSDQAMPVPAAPQSRQNGVFRKALEGMLSGESLRPEKSPASMAAGTPFGINEPKKEELRLKDKKAMPAAIGDITVSKGLPTDAIQKLLEQHLAEMQACIGKAGRSGKLRLELVIDARGKVRTVRFIGDSLKERAVAQCLRRLVRTWDFSPAGMTRKAVISFSLTF